MSNTGSPFLWNAGTSNNGLLISSALSLLTTEMNSLANSSVAVSSVGGSSGVFTNSNTGQGIWGDILLKLGAISSALSAGACLAGWFLTSPDGGTTFEPTGAAPSRPPDFLIPLPATTITAATSYKSAGLVRIPALPFKIIVQNKTGQTFAASANTLILAPSAVTY